MEDCGVEGPWAERTAVAWMVLGLPVEDGLVMEQGEVTLEEAEDGGPLVEQSR